MKFISVYRIPDMDDKGYSSGAEYIHINSAGYYEFDEPFGATHRKYGRKDYLLSYNHAGNVTIKAGGQEYDIAGGSVFIFKPNEEQYYGQANKAPIASYWTHFTGFGAGDLLERAGLGAENVFYPGVNSEIPALFEKLIEEIDEKQECYEPMAALLLEQIIFQIARNIDSGQKAMGAIHPGISKTVNYIHINYQDKIDITELAGIAGLSPSRYSALFKDIMHASPLQYLTSYRMQKARELLLHTNLSVKQISCLAGFPDQLYFSRVFKKYEKSSPVHFKKRSMS
jgi:AraC family transcriptional regulator, arabinose operon regulatory protein